jgi:hypothetical protein
MIRAFHPHLLLVGVVILFLSACSRVTPQNLEKIKMGMSSEQVKAVLGNPSDTLTQGALGLSSTTYTYKKGTSVVKIVFLNDKVMAKNGELE